MRNVSHILEKQLTDYLVTDQARFYRLAYSYLKNREEALDAVQTAVCRALEKQGELKEPEALRAWFYHILVHVCMDVLIDYEIKSQTDTTVSFVVDFAEGWVAAMQQRYCYNLDLANDKDITLADVLGEDWVGICNDAVNAKIAADESGLFFTPEQGGFTTVDDATSFYLNEDGSVTLVFPEYSIAAGAAGIVEIPVVA